MTCRIHVLLVDHDLDHHGPAIEILELFSYKVTTIKLASMALSVLARGNHRFDLLIENINSPDLCGFKLLQEAVDMDLPVVHEDDVMLTKRALEGGAFLCIKKPLTMETVKYLWQHVLREKVSKLRENERFKEFVMHNKLHDGFGEEDPMRGYISDYMNPNENYISNKKVRYMKIVDDDEEANRQHHDVAKFRKKVWTEWTQELHEKFMDAVRKLGEGRNKVLGDNGERSSHEQYTNRFSHVGLETLNVAQLGLSLGMDDEPFMSNEQLVFDAQSVTPSIDTSLEQKNTTEDYYEFPNIDCMIQNISTSQQEQKMDPSGGQDAFDLNPVCSDQASFLMGRSWMIQPQLREMKQQRQIMVKLKARKARNKEIDGVMIFHLDQIIMVV
ncbi:Two-component response regulator ORR26 [Sesamum angolense]|uniref:Two-component response regulator ORR26 n=1 Tax=Sesamum angolense TaxID=2727404 RepID=A0AAE1X6Z6_9LAMI|nr:Two-component response regulator ORR26 [Sesamum angolense]